MPTPLSEGLARADPATIEEIYNGDLGNKIRNYVRKKNGDAAMAEDVLTKTIYRVIDLMGTGQYEEQNRINGFLMGVAKKIFQEEWKKNGNKRPENPTDPISLTKQFDRHFSGSLPKELETKFSMDEIQKYLEKLSARDQEVLRLFYLEDLKLSEIDKRLELRPNHSNVIRKRAVEQLRKWVRPEQPPNTFEWK